MGLAVTTYDAATGALREIYDRMRERPLPPAYRPSPGGIPGIVAMHGLDPELIPRVFATATTLDGAGPLAEPERELVNALAARLHQCVYLTACHAGCLSTTHGDEALARAIIDDPGTVATRTPTPRMAMLAELTTLVTSAPWTLSRAHLRRARAAGLSDEDVLHLIALSSFAGHLNRIAHAVDAPLDGQVALAAPGLDRSAAPWPSAPALLVGRPAIDVAHRPATTTAFTEWRNYIFYSHDTPLTRRQRTLIARWVATWLGDGGISPPTDLTVNPLDDLLRGVAEVATLAPWRLGDEAFAPLRGAGFDDAALFDACATASSAGMFSRIEVALVALST